MTTKTTYKVGDKVRILDVENIIGGETHWDNGDIVKVTKAEGRIWLERKKTKPSPQKPFLHDDELRYIEKIESKPTKNQRITALEKTVADLQAEVEALKAAQKLPTMTVKADVDVAKIAESLAKEIEKHSPKSPNERRKAIIDEAKAFVEENLAKNHPGAAEAGVWLTDNDGSIITDEAEFVINDKKRTVVVLIKDNGTSNVYTKAIAKCAPDDVFNADIGKAIALGRALGLDVKRFEKVVQPTEFAVGQIALCGHGKPYTITEVRKDRGMTKPGTFHWKSELRIGVVKISDDSEAKY